MKRYIILLFFILILQGCNQTVSTTNYIIGDSNRLGTESIQSPEKTVGTSFGASISATAAASNNGSAENAGNAEASTESKK